jgi:hypothetical protein
MSLVAILFWLLASCVLIYAWSFEAGWLRAILAGLCRLGWTLPLMLSLFPETVTKRIPGSIALQPIHLLVDDSASMAVPDARGLKPLMLVNDTLKRIDASCLQFGCLPRITKLSDLAQEVKQGYSPLSHVIEPWLYKTGGEPWMVLSDGGDFRPNMNWDDRLKGRGAVQNHLRPDTDSRSSKTTIGMVLPFGTPRAPGFSLDAVQMAPLAFEGKSVHATVTVGRTNADMDGPRRIQVQVSIDGKVVGGGETSFAAGAGSAEVELTFSAPKRGPHIVAFKSLPVDGERDIWDNTQTRALDVLPNTVGVLHLLGSPAWDGRFMRRFLKAEPKFDVISFFILRDPWDSQQVNEREMSLIPFPVERLFKEELVNFRVIVMQNFTLMRFLQPEFQENLAKFVKDGGGLLFVGGPRALTETDMASSPLSWLLPFGLKSGDGAAMPQFGGSGGPLDDAMGGMGTTYDPDGTFTIEMANPDSQRRALASVYENWQGLASRLSSAGPLKGIQNVDLFRFRDSEVTPLLQARLRDGRVVPLAVASYPGKGRALWIFSDALWQLAMSADPQNARSDYHAFMDGAMSWLTRDDMRGTLRVRDFWIQKGINDDNRLRWRATLSGSATRYVKQASTARYIVCGSVVNADSVTYGGASGDTLSLEGYVNVSAHDGSLCGMTVDLSHPAFGSLSIGAWTIVPETLLDSDIGPSPAKLRQLATVTGAEYVADDTERSRKIESWLQYWGASVGESLPDKLKSKRDFYWPADIPWIWFLLTLIPAEILLRRWHLLTGGSRHDS